MGSWRGRSKGEQWAAWYPTPVPNRSSGWPGRFKMAAAREDRNLPPPCEQMQIYTCRERNYFCETTKGWMNGFLTTNKRKRRNRGCRELREPCGGLGSSLGWWPVGAIDYVPSTSIEIDSVLRPTWKITKMPSQLHCLEAFSSKKREEAGTRGLCRYCCAPPGREPPEPAGFCFRRQKRMPSSNQLPKL